MLDNICFADYIDRITFQKQIWQFNEMSSLIKTFKNNKKYHTMMQNNENQPKLVLNDIRFTKVLTKYSTEYNNSIFIQNLCQELSMDKKDIFAFFLDFKKNTNIDDLNIVFENYEDIKVADRVEVFEYIEEKKADL
jgi:hypothetical protein